MQLDIQSLINNVANKNLKLNSNLVDIYLTFTSYDTKVVPIFKLSSAFLHW